MKTFKKILCTLLVVVICLTSAPLQGFVGLEWPSLPEINFGNFELPKLDFGSWFSSKASAATEGYYTYTVTNGKATITDVNTSISGDITIPATLGGYSVTTIGDSAFYSCDSLTSITIPDSVTTIGDEAFYSCNSLTSVTIPDSVTTIGDRAFYYCDSLTSITIPDSVTTIGDYALASCYSLTSVTIGDSVTAIGDEAFSYCNSLISITIPDSVTTIGDRAFDGCYSLTSVTIGDSVTTIGDRAFYACGRLTSIVVDADNPAYSSDSRGALFDKNKTILIQYPEGNTNSSYSIPDSVTTIGYRAFEYCDSLTSVTIGDSVTTIGNYAFNSCDSLTSITIPDSVTTIGDDAFEYCGSLTSVTIGDSVTTIGDAAFFWCDSLTSITIPDSVTTIGEEAFYSCDSLTSITIPDSVTTIGEEAFYSCDSLTSITIGDSVTTIGDNAFDDCDSLTSIVVDADNPAYSSDSRGDLFDKNKTILIQYPIGNTNSSYSIPNSVTTIGVRAFDGCYSLTSITIGDSVTTIGDEAFASCDSLTSVTIGDSVTTIGDEAFRSCGSLTSITIGDSVTTIGNWAFYYCDSLTSVTIPDSVTTIGAYAFAGCDSLTSVTIPNSVTTIGVRAFNSCDSLTSITIGDSVTTIGDWAFYNCNSLTDVYYNGTEEQWKKITIGSSNDCLTSATIHYNSSGAEVATGYKREHVVDNWKALNQSYKSEYLAGFAVPMDGTNGNPDYLIPGQSENMIPQGLAYWPEKDWVLVSSYDKNEENPSAIFALDRETGAFVAQFNMYTKDGKAWKTHAGGIGVSEHNLYITCDRGVAYFPLSDLDVPSGTVKDITRADYVNFGQLGKAYSSYVNVCDGILWAGNFYSNYPWGLLNWEIVLEGLKILPPSWDTPASSDFNSLVLGFRLSGNNSEKEWNNLKALEDSATYRIGIDNELECIQGIAFKKMGKNAYKMYLSRTTDVSFGASISTATVTLNDKSNIEVKESDFSYYRNLPGTEGITFIGDDLHILYESGALSACPDLVNHTLWSTNLKCCTDVIWKINEEDLLQIPRLDASWFLNNAYDGYNHKLAQFCADYCVLGYNYNKEEIEYYLNKTGFTLQKSNMNAARDEVNYFIADGDLDFNGQIKKLVFVGCIGSHKSQWYSDFDPWSVASETDYADVSEMEHTHHGFANAREYVYGKLEDYLKEKKIDKSNCIILFTGHSRGAAAVNLLAAKLIDNAKTLGFDANYIYTYGFATPNTTLKSNGTMFKKYESIINIVNPEDLVTKLLPAAWDYSRYGVTYTLPTKTNVTKSYYNSILDKVQTYTVLNGLKKQYEPYDQGEVAVYNIVKSMTDSLSDIYDFYNKRDLYSSVSTYEYFRDRILPFVTHESVWTDFIFIVGTTLKFFTFQKDITDFFVWHQVAEPEFEDAHLMQTYAAFVKTMTSGQMVAERNGYNGTANCPVDVEIYDKSTGELVGRIVDNVVDEEVATGENAIVMTVDGDSKSFWLPSNGDYDIKLIGNDEGTMDYTMSEVDSDVGEVKRVNFFDVEITDGLKMTADVEGEDFVIEEHELIFEDGETLEPTEIFTEKDIETYNINISASEGGSASSSQTAKSGDYVSLDAIVEEGWKFAGWYENDELISTETTLAFVAKSDRSLEAKFEHVDHSLCEWYEVTPATCEEKGSEQRDCSECDYSETQEIPAVEHNYEAVITPATCYSNGFTTNTCTKCGNGYTSNITAMLTHNFSDWYTVTDATCEANGTEQRDCSACDYSETQEIPNRGHSYETVITQPGCTTQGYTTYTCIVCGEGYTSDIIDETGHKLGDWYEVTPATCEEKGSEQRDCSECDYSETQEIPATSHDFDGSECKNCDYDKADDCGCNCHKGGIAGFFFKLILFFQKIFKTNKVCKCGKYHY